MADSIVLQKELLGKTICARTALTDEGITVLVAGGDRSHIGSVSVADPDGNLTTVTFPEHKEAVISEKWASDIFNKLHQQVVVSAGVHYDNITRDQIMQVLAATDELLEGLLEQL